MKTLSFGSACTVVRLVDSSLVGQPLGEQLQPFLEGSPNIVLDVEGIDFTSMMIGELTNLAREFDVLWGTKPHTLTMTNLKSSSRLALETMKFDRVIPIVQNYEEALKRVFSAANDPRSATN